jgi:hypothetical protein
MDVPRGTLRKAVHKLAAVGSFAGNGTGHQREGLFHVEQVRFLIIQGLPNVPHGTIRVS